MKRLLTITLLSILLTACAPSAQAIQTSIAQTQAAWSPTPKPTSTPIPTFTPNPCTDKGWSDISIYLHQFDQVMNNAQIGTSILALLTELGNFKDKINTVNIDACSEQARQKVVEGLGNEIYGWQLLLTHGDRTQAATAIAHGITTIKDAKKELAGLGITLNWP